MNYDELEAKVIDSIDNNSEAQVQFSQDIVPSKTLLGLGIGGGISGIVSSAVTKFSPINLEQFGIDGIVPIVAGTLIKLIVKPKGMSEDVSNGLIVAGISQAVEGFTGGKLAQERVEPKNTHIQSGVIY